MNLVCYEHGLLWMGYEQVCSECGLFWMRSVLNAVCYEWTCSVLSQLVCHEWSGLFWTDIIQHTLWKSPLVCYDIIQHTLWKSQLVCYDIIQHTLWKSQLVCYEWSGLFSTDIIQHTLLWQSPAIQKILGNWKLARRLEKLIHNVYHVLRGGRNKRRKLLTQKLTSQISTFGTWLKLLSSFATKSAKILIHSTNA